jgi:methyl-accepting chemotaxis protein
LAQVEQQLGATGEHIANLAEQAQSVGEIIAAVSEIAEQTNLLALNAAIEAAGAGEHGRGFAVVAGEVKELADQSRRATTQVRKILGEIQQATTAAVRSTEEVSRSAGVAAGVAARAGETIKALADTLADTGRAAAQIVASAGQQAAGIAQVNEAMRGIEKVARLNVAAIREVEQEAQGLNSLSGRLAGLVAV